MKLKHTLALPALLAGALALPTVAHAADQTGAAGKITNLEVLSPSAENYVQYHGRVFITASKRTTEYRWGGTSCGSKTLSADMLNLLVQAQRGGANVAPVFAKGSGSTSCLVGFAIE